MNTLYKNLFTTNQTYQAAPAQSPAEVAQASTAEANVQQLIDSYLQRYAFAAPGGNSARFYPQGKGASRLPFDGDAALERTRLAQQIRAARKRLDLIRQQRWEMPDDPWGEMMEMDVQAEVDRHR